MCTLPFLLTFFEKTSPLITLIPSLGQSPFPLRKRKAFPHDSPPKRVLLPPGPTVANQVAFPLLVLVYEMSSLFFPQRSPLIDMFQIPPTLTLDQPPSSVEGPHILSRRYPRTVFSPLFPCRRSQLQQCNPPFNYYIFDVIPPVPRLPPFSPLDLVREGFESWTPLSSCVVPS